MADRRFRPLLPRGPSIGDLDEGGSEQRMATPPILARKRVGVAVACDNCRKRKAKCDGRRPSCWRCRTHSQDCTYEFPPTTVSTSSARRVENAHLLQENQELRMLYDYLRHLPEADAYETLGRMRNVGDPLTLLNAIRQAETLPVEPSATPYAGAAALERMDFAALEKSHIKVPARPWTSVAGDGVVSELITAWFMWDSPSLHAFIDRKLFVRDMRCANPSSAAYCSPFLVNAICAIKSILSDTARAVSRISKQDLGAQFLAEAKKHLDQESGKASIPAIQGLWILFADAALRGSDRIGDLYRYMCYDMLGRMRLGRKFLGLPDDEQNHEQRRAISTVTWGVFYLESMVSINFSKTYIVPPPQIPCLFDERADRASVENENLDILGHPYHSGSSPQPPITQGVMNALQPAALLMYRVAKHNASDDTMAGEPADLETRTHFYVELMAFEGHLRPAHVLANNFTPQTCYIRSYISAIAHAILRPLHPGASLNNTRSSVQDMILDCCRSDVELMERYFTTFSTREFSPIVLGPPLNASMALLPLISSGALAQDLFVRTCRLMRIIGGRIPVARYMLQGWRAMFWSMKQDAPAGALPYLSNLGAEARNELQDLPADILITHVRDVRSAIHGDDRAELGPLLTKWSAMSIQ